MVLELFEEGLALSLVSMSPEQGVINHQHDNRSDYGDNHAVEIEAGDAACAHGGEEKAPDDRPDNAVKQQRSQEAGDGQPVRNSLRAEIANRRRRGEQRNECDQRSGGKGHETSPRIVKIGSYITAPMWLVFLILGLLISLQANFIRPEYFPKGFSLFPTWPQQSDIGGLGVCRHDGATRRAQTAGLFGSDQLA